MKDPMIELTWRPGIILGHYFTNLDDYHREEWPRIFAAVPRPRERVRAKSGRILWVVQVEYYICSDDGSPRIQVELHKPHFAMPSSRDPEG